MIVLSLVLALALAADPVPVDDETEEYPVEFRGTWAPTLAACKDESSLEMLTIGKTKIWGYEADSKLLKLTPIAYINGPNGADAKSINALTAERGESEIGIGKLRLSLSAGKLYTSRIDVVSEEDQWKHGNVRCP